MEKTIELTVYKYKGNISSTTAEEGKTIQSSPTLAMMRIEGLTISLKCRINIRPLKSSKNHPKITSLKSFLKMSLNSPTFKLLKSCF
jgi:hypothetical protein